MTYIVCRNCKRFSKVNVNLPLNFDKCENCGHTLEFAGDERELQFVLNDIDLPKISYNKLCSVCKSVNPRETGACLYCGSTSFLLQYDLDSVNKYQQSLDNLNNNGNEFIKQESAITQGSKNINWVFKIFSIFIGLIDFLLFASIGIELFIGDVNLLSGNVMLFTQKYFIELILITISSLIISGILSIFVLPKMSYKNSFLTSASIGIIIGIITGIISQSPLVFIIGALLFGCLTGIGGVIGELIVRQLLRRVGPRTY